MENVNYRRDKRGKATLVKFSIITLYYIYNKVATEIICLRNCVDLSRSSLPSLIFNRMHLRQRYGVRSFTVAKCDLPLNERVTSWC